MDLHEIDTEYSGRTVLSDHIKKLHLTFMVWVQSPLKVKYRLSETKKKNTKMNIASPLKAFFKFNINIHLVYDTRHHFPNVQHTGIAFSHLAHSQKSKDMRL